MTERPAVRISIETDAAAETRKTVESGLYAYNDQFAGPMENSILTIGARNTENTIIGGLIANLQPGWKWMTIHRLWIDEAYRRAGIGRRLLEAAEEEARKSGCLHVAVDTMEFQARGFYEKLGYSVYAVQEDYPAGHRKFLLRKTFAAG
jgi:ribosomal protein S18 acetylase RimI-like enzyme